MVLKKNLHFGVHNKNCIFRSLHEKDVSEDYIAALNLQRAYLIDNPTDLDIPWQRAYVRRIRLSRSDAICGLFSKTGLIGTAGIQSISRGGDDTTFGIFVLDKESRGKGYGKTLVWATCYLLNSLFEIRHFRAGAESANIPSVFSYLSCGFVVTDSNQGKLRLEINSEHLKKPDFIDNILIV